jgi:hypothetical protein
MKTKSLHASVLMATGMMVLSGIGEFNAAFAGCNPPTIDISVITNVLCFGGHSGTVTVSAIGTGILTYNWNNGSTSQTDSNLGAGGYTVTVTDGNGCTSIASANITQPANAFTSTVSTINSGCQQSNGSASVSPSGGVVRYAYFWSNSATGQTASNLPSGAYEVTVTDANGCSTTNVAAISDTSAPIINSLIGNNLPCVNSVGSATVSGSGGSGALTYSWSNGANGVTGITYLAVGIYAVTISDHNGCEAVSTVSITQPGPMTFTTSSTPATCDASNGSASITGMGGTGNLSYSWSPGGGSGTNITGLYAGSYTVTVTDANFCYETSVVFVQRNVTLINVTATTIKNATSSSDCDGSANSIATGGTGTLTYDWSSDSTASKATNLCVGIYTVTVTDANGCTGSSTTIILDSSQFVWPGDANRDLIANNLDILAIGIGYDSTGPVRPNASIAWLGQPAANWGTTLANGKDYKNVDCNGDGVINGNDTTAVVQNYGLTHTLKLREPIYVTGLPDLTLGIPLDTIEAGGTVNIPILLGTVSTPANNVYGLAFSINYDPTIVDTSKLHLSFSGSWMGTYGSNLINITKYFGAMGRIDVGVTRTDHTNVSGSGQIGVLSVTMNTEVYGKTLISVGQTTCISNAEAIIQLNSGKDSVFVSNSGPTGINSMSDSRTVNIYPNPTSGSFVVDLNGNEVREMKLINVFGQTVWLRNSIVENNVIIDMQGLQAGAYFISIVTPKERIVKQINVIK